MTDQVYNMLLSWGVVFISFCFWLNMFAPTWIQGWQWRVLNVLGASTCVAIVIMVMCK